MYRRNRYYDSKSGRFTQEDPLGLAGGLNVYGYAAGDPVNYSDPFGLCPEDAGGDGKTEDYSDCPEGSSGYYAYLDAEGNGGVVNDFRGAVASCKEDDTCKFTAVAGAVVTGGIVVYEGRAVLAGAAYALFRPGGLLNSNRYLRVGIGRHGGNEVVRISGNWVKLFKESGHIDLWTRGPLP